MTSNQSVDRSKNQYKSTYSTEMWPVLHNGQITVYIIKKRSFMKHATILHDK